MQVLRLNLALNHHGRDTVSLAFYSLLSPRSIYLIQPLQYPIQDYRFPHRIGHGSSENVSVVADESETTLRLCNLPSSRVS